MFSNEYDYCLLIKLKYNEFENDNNIPVFGQTAFTAILSALNSSAIPRTHIDIPYLAIVYAT